MTTTARAKQERRVRQQGPQVPRWRAKQVRQVGDGYERKPALTAGILRETTKGRQGRAALTAWSRESGVVSLESGQQRACPACCAPGALPSHQWPTSIPFHRQQAPHLTAVPVAAGDIKVSWAIMNSRCALESWDKHVHRRGCEGQTKEGARKPQGLCEYALHRCAAAHGFEPKRFETSRPMPGCQ